MLFVRYKFGHIKHNNTTLSKHFSNLSLVHVWHLLMTQKMAQCQIFTAQTALLHHLLFEICISFLYTSYVFMNKLEKVLSEGSAVLGWGCSSN